MEFQVIIRNGNAFYWIRSKTQERFDLGVKEFCQSFADWQNSDKEWWESFEYPYRREIHTAFPGTRHEHDAIDFEVKCLGIGYMRQCTDQMMANRPEMGIRPTLWDIVIPIEDAMQRWGKSAQLATA